MNYKKYIVGTLFLTFSIVLFNFICFKSSALKNEDKIPMYRLYNPNNYEHFYTAGMNERDTLKKNGWVYEGIGWIAPSKSGTPVYRLYSAVTSDHHYTMDTNERDTLVRDHGYVYEGIGWYSDDSKRVPLYRQYAPFLISGAHNYTTDSNERRVLTKERGWIDEGVGWYALDANYDSDIDENAPAAYAKYLKPIKAKHPNFKFEFKNVEPDFQSAIAGESVHGRSLIYQTHPSAKFCSTTDKSYNPFTNSWNPIDGSRWYQANERVIAYYLDPRNYMTESRIYAFLKISDVENATVEGCADMLKGTFMDNVRVNLPDGSYKSYAEIFYQTGRDVGINPYFLISKVIQEVGRGGSRSSNGKDNSYPGIYNFYNIHAYAGTDPVANGLSWAAKDGNFGRPWNSQYKSIRGGALWIANGYIDKAQDTIYFMKFDVVDNPLKKNGFYSHQYMTNVEGAVSEGWILKKGYENSVAGQNTITFLIPVYKNLPSEVCKYPN